MAWIYGEFGLGCRAYGKSVSEYHVLHDVPYLSEQGRQSTPQRTIVQKENPNSKRKILSPQP